MYTIEMDIKTRIIIKSYWIRLVPGKPSKSDYVMYKCLMYLDCVGLYTPARLRKGGQIYTEQLWVIAGVDVPGEPQLSVAEEKAVEQNLKYHWSSVGMVIL